MDTVRSRSTMLAAGVITIVIMIMFTALASARSPASIRCRAPMNGRFPTISVLRATHIGCTTARAVAEAIQEGWSLHEELPTYSFAPYGGAPVFTCRYQMHHGNPNPYETARCTSGRRLVTMELGS